MSKKTLVDISVNTKNSDLIIYVKSKIFHDYFNSFGVEFSQDMNWCGNLPHKVGVCISDSRYQSILNYWHNDQLLVNSSDYPNLSFLRSENLDKGVRFLFKNPLSEKELKNFVQKFSDYSLDFYNEYILPREIRNKVSAIPDLKKVKKGLSRIENEERKTTFDIKIDSIPDMDFTRIFESVQSA